MFITKHFKKLESIEYIPQSPIANIKYLTDISFDTFNNRYQFVGLLEIFDFDYFNKYEQPYLVQIGNKFIGKLIINQIDNYTDFTFVETFRLVSDIGQISDSTVDGSIIVKEPEVDVITYVYPLNTLDIIPEKLNVFNTYKYVDTDSVQKLSELFVNDILDSTAYFYWSETDNSLKFRIILPVVDNDGNLKTDRQKQFGKRLKIQFFSKPQLETLGIQLKEFNGAQIVDIDSLKNTFLNVQPPHQSYTFSQDDFTEQPFEFDIVVVLNKDTELEESPNKNNSSAIPIAIVSIEENLFETSYLNTETFKFVIENQKI